MADRPSGSSKKGSSRSKSGGYKLEGSSSARTTNNPKLNKTRATGGGKETGDSVRKSHRARAAKWMGS